MNHRSTGHLAVVIAVVVVGLAGVGVVGASVSDAPPRATTQWDNVTMTQEFKLTPDTPGEIHVTLSVSLPDRMTEFEVWLPQRATLLGTDGFRHRDGRTYAWDGETGRPTITYALGVNETVDEQGPERGSGTYLYADTGSWALVSPPKPSVRYRWEYAQGEDVNVGIERELTVAGEGAVGEHVAFLGPVERYTRDAHGQSFHLVVPTAAAMTADPGRVLDVLANASGNLRIGDRDEKVFAVVAPTTVEWAVRGLETGDSDMWVAADEPVTGADNTWLHEYVHTRQRLNTTRSTAWLTEATATYYAATLALESGLTDFERFSEVLSRGTRDRYDDVVLADPTTWIANAEYNKGALVTGQLDRRIRLATNRTSRFETVFATLNDGRVIDLGRFLGAVERIGNESIATTADRLLTTTATPSMWTRSQHETAFDATPAEFTYTLAPESAPYRIEGPYRNVSTTDVVQLAVGETLTVPVSITNVGGSTGTYNATLAVNGTVVSRATGTLAPSESTTVELSHTFERTGQYPVRVGPNETVITVVKPATATVQNVTANRTTLAEPRAVTLSATVTNDKNIPATGTVSFTRNGTTVAERTVSLGPGETRVVETTVSLTAPGNYVLGANGQTTAVVVDPAQFTVTIDRTNAITVDGEYRTVSTVEIPPLVTGETVRIPVTVRNTGGLVGTYSTNLSIDGDVVSRGRGTLQPGNSTTVTLPYTFERPGTYRLSVANRTAYVQVSEPASPIVRTIEPDRTTLSEPGNLTVTARVGNDAPIPAVGAVRFTRDGTTVVAKQVTLRVNETRTITAMISLLRPGSYLVGAGGEATTVTVTETTTDETTSKPTTSAADTETSEPTTTDAIEPTTTGGVEPTTATGPGFTVASAILVVIAAVLFRRR